MAIPRPTEATSSEAQPLQGSEESPLLGRAASADPWIKETTGTRSIDIGGPLSRKEASPFGIPRRETTFLVSTPKF